MTAAKKLGNVQGLFPNRIVDDPNEVLLTVKDICAWQKMGRDSVIRSLGLAGIKPKRLGKSRLLRYRQKDVLSVFR